VQCAVRVGFARQIRAEVVDAASQITYEHFVKANKRIQERITKVRRFLLAARADSVAGCRLADLFVEFELHGIHGAVQHIRGPQREYCRARVCLPVCNGCVYV
jgi:hypothetical protein